MERIYLDNAATTPLDPEVLGAMMPYLTTHFGNPSSIYSYGRETRLAVENARKTVARILGAKPGEIFFTSGGTESNNTAIGSAIRDLGCTHIITSPIEHHAVLHTVEYWNSEGKVTVSYVPVQPDGSLDYKTLEEQLETESKAGKRCLVTLMHANNEIGTLLKLNKVGELCARYDALFHSDCVQTVGHYPIDLSRMPVHFISAAGHKFHGPKGVGLLYVNENVTIRPMILGGGQERNLRAGTENVYGIVGFAKALEIATRDYEKDAAYIRGLRTYMCRRLREEFDSLQFNGNPEEGLYTVLSVCFPRTDRSEMLLFSLDMAGICTSGGSACSSGADIGSHVIKALGRTDEWVTVRFSFSKYNTEAEIEAVIGKLKQLT
ncbi:MAG TPA: cysteine desulfurase family protein [Chitinophagaceae bacterium]|jgi:cysteine desulfurase|nr:cysteine desulfurase family protein [Chitinophagaceae bacterium]